MSFWKSLRVCITGGAGMVGCHLVEMLLNQGALIQVVDNMSRGTEDNLRKYKKDISMAVIDARVKDNLLRYWQKESKPKIVIN